MSNADADDTRDNLTRLLNQGRRKRAHVGYRYSSFVRGLRFALPLAALGIITVVVAWPKMDETITPVPHDSIIAPKTGRNELINPHFENMTADHLPYTVTASRAAQRFEDPNIVALENPVADITLKGGAKVNATAQSGLYRQDVKILSLDGAVVVRHQSGYTMHSPRLNFSVADNISWTDTAIHGEGPRGTIDARAMNANNQTGVIIFTGPARLTLIPDDKGPTP